MIWKDSTDKPCVAYLVRRCSGFFASGWALVATTRVGKFQSESSDAPHRKKREVLARVFSHQFHGCSLKDCEDTQVETIQKWDTWGLLPSVGATLQNLLHDLHITGPPNSSFRIH